MVFSFLHAADIHLDSPLRGLSRYQGAPTDALRGATRRALENLVDLAIRCEVDFLLIAGDLYDGDWTDYNTGQFFVQQMARLGSAGIRVVAISGNHDASSKLTRQLSLPQNMQMLSVKKPATVVFEELEVAIHGQGFATPEVSEDLSLAYPHPEPNLFNIGILHTSADGREGHARYAPCSVERLRQHGYDYWALGHIHKREILCEQPYIVFPGNIQGRHIREEGDKGATLVRVEDQKIISISHESLDVVRWAHLQIDLTDVLNAPDMLDAVSHQLESSSRLAEGRMLAARVELNCNPQLYTFLLKDAERWTQEVRSLAIQSSRKVWIEKVRIGGTVEPDEKEFGPELEVVNFIMEGLRDLCSSPQEIGNLGQEIFSKLDSKLPRQWKVGEDGLNLLSEDFLRDLLRQTGPLLEARLGYERGQ